jgi:hypothetical protein
MRGWEALGSLDVEGYRKAVVIPSYGSVRDCAAVLSSRGGTVSIVHLETGRTIATTSIDANVPQMVQDGSLAQMSHEGATWLAVCSVDERGGGEVVLLRCSEGTIEKAASIVGHKTRRSRCSFLRGGGSQEKDILLVAAGGELVSYSLAGDRVEAVRYASASDAEPLAIKAVECEGERWAVVGYRMPGVKGRLGRIAIVGTPDLKILRTLDDPRGEAVSGGSVLGQWIAPVIGSDEFFVGGRADSMYRWSTREAVADMDWSLEWNLLSGHMVGAALESGNLLVLAISAPGGRGSGRVLTWRVDGHKKELVVCSDLGN